jgi:hypothetical protein
VFARQLHPHLGHPYLVVLVLHSIDLVRSSAWWRGCDRHHDSCNPHRVFVHSHNLERHIPPHPSVTLSLCHPTLLRPVLPSTSPLWRISRAAADPSLSFSALPSFSSHRCDPAVQNHAIRPDVWRPGCEQVARIPRVSNFHGQLSDPTFRNAPGEHLFIVSCLVFGCKFTESYFFLTLAFRDPIRAMAGMKIQNCAYHPHELAAPRPRPCTMPIQPRSCSRSTEDGRTMRHRSPATHNAHPTPILLTLTLYRRRRTTRHSHKTAPRPRPRTMPIQPRSRSCSVSLLRNHAIFTLTLMDLVLFFLDTFVWYIIWNTVYSILAPLCS